MNSTGGLLQKYNLPIPRYTSYPTVPFWDISMDTSRWKREFTEQFHLSNSGNGLSLYLHLPFCESLCTYCGCNKKITTNHSVEQRYIETLLQEWKLYRALMKEAPVIRELHIGGGTPTFFSPENLEKLLTGILRFARIHPDHEFSIEGHPNNTTVEHLHTLSRLGFRRISYGVQDNDPNVQRVINRIQPVENVRRATESARAAGFQSVNFDLIYGLPLQTVETIRQTILQTISMRPDRIAFYSYAHVPWTSRGQRLFDENDLPSAEEKMKLYECGRDLFLQHGYVNIGMDHFALPSDTLYSAHQQGKLHRNFMGYTTHHTSMILGLGVSSISDAGTGYAQNEKTLHDYTTSIKNGKVAVFRGYFLNEEDVAFRNYILDISCRGKTRFRPEDLPVLKALSFPLLDGMKEDGLVRYDESGLELTASGLQFIRNVCSAFDLKLIRQGVEGQVFSKAI